MSELVVIYDPNQEMAAIVNVDDRCGWGPAMVGPQAEMILRAFLDTVPFDVSEFTSYDVQRMFAGFLGQAGLAADAPPAESDSMETQPSGDNGMANPDALAQAEAANATDVPPEQPADTDMEADTGASDHVIPCVNCNGTGMIHFGEGIPDSKCNMCNGSGKLTIAAA